MTPDQAPGSCGADDLPVTTAMKRPWHTPKLEEVDYTAAEAGSGAGDFADEVTYAS